MQFSNIKRRFGNLARYVLIFQPPMELLDMQLGSVTQLVSNSLPANSAIRLVGRDSGNEILLATQDQQLEGATPENDSSYSTVYLACLQTNRVMRLAKLQGCSQVLSASCSRDRARLLASVQLNNPTSPKQAYAILCVNCKNSSNGPAPPVLVLTQHERPVCCRLLRQSAINEPALEYFLQFRCLSNGRGTVELKKFSQPDLQLEAAAGTEGTTIVQLHQVIKKHVICCQYCPVNRSLFLLHIDSFYGDVHQFTFTSLHCSANRLVYSIVCSFPIQLGIRASRLNRHFSPAVPGGTAQQVLLYSWQSTGLAANCAMPPACDHLVMLVDGSAGSGADWLFKVFIVPNRCVFTCALSSDTAMAVSSVKNLPLRWLLSDGFVFVFIGNAALCVVNANPGALPLSAILRLDWPIFDPAEYLLDAYCPDIVAGLEIFSVGRGWRLPLLIGRFPLSRRRLLAELVRSDCGGSRFAARLLHLLVSLRPSTSSSAAMSSASSVLDSGQPVWQLLRALLSNPRIRIGLALRQLLVSLVARRMRQQFPQVHHRLCLSCYAAELSEPNRRGGGGGAGGGESVIIGPGHTVETSFGELFADISFAERPQSELQDSCWRRLLEGLAASRGGAGAGPLGRQVFLDGLWRRDANDAGLLSPDEEDNVDSLDGSSDAFLGEFSGFEVLDESAADEFGASAASRTSNSPLAEVTDARAFLSAALDESRLRLAPSFKYRLCRQSMPLLQPHLPDQTDLVTYQNALDRALTTEIGFLCRLAHWYGRDPAESLACLQQLALCLAEFMPVPAGLQLALTCLSLLALSPDQVLSRLQRCPGYFSSDWRVAAFALLHLPDTAGSQQAAKRLKQRLLNGLPRQLAERLVTAAAAAPGPVTRPASYRLAVPAASGK